MRIGAAIFCLLVLCSCAANRYDPALPTSPVAQPNQTELSDYLQAEFTRLGIDPYRATAAPPAGVGNSVFDLALTLDDPDGPGGNQPEGINLAWTEQLIGDYNQDGLVNVSDLTPVGQYWNANVTYDPASEHPGITWWPQGDPTGSGALNWRLARVDGNGDGLVYMSDITTIAQHWLEQLDGFYVERAMHVDGLPASWETLAFGPSYSQTPLIARTSGTFTGSTGAAGGVLRFQINIPLDNPLEDQSFRVRAHDGATGQLGQESNMVSYAAVIGTDEQPPQWPGTTGITAVQQVATGLEIRFGTAEDIQTPPVTYRVYWEQFDPSGPQSPFDYETAWYVDVDASPVVLDTLAEGNYYRMAVRARDSASPPNWDQNEVVLSSFYGTGDTFPPVWDGTPGIQGLQYGDGQAVVSWGQAIDYHNDGSQVWESGPVVYRVYHGPGESPAIGGAEYAEFTDTGEPANAAVIEGLDTSADHWFVIRARDQATYPNEDANEAYLVGHGMGVTDTDLPGPGPGVPAGYSRIRSVHIVSSPGHGYNKLACIWRRPDDTANSWLSSWLITSGGLVHDTDFYLPHDHEQFTVKAWTLDSDGNHELLYVFYTIYETGDRLLHYRQATGGMIEHLLDGQYATYAGFDLNLNPWIIGYIDNGFVIPYPYFEMYFSYLPVNEPEVFFTSTPAVPHYSYDFHSVVHLQDGTIEAAGRDNGEGAGELRLRHSLAGTQVLDGFPIPNGADMIQQVFGRGITQPVLSFSGPDGNGRFIGFCQGDVRRDFHAPFPFTANDDRYRIRAADSISEVIFATELTTDFWHQTEQLVTLNAVTIWHGDHEVTVPVPIDTAGPARVEAVAVLGGGEYCWIWSQADGPWQYRRSNFTLD